jgi:hypothetical protein
MMDVSAQIEQGFPPFMSACIAGAELTESDTPHPFDSHPPLGRRLENLGLDLQSVFSQQLALPDLADSWFSAIEGAAAIEAEQWKAFEESFHKAHQESLAWRFTPEGQTEIVHVAKYFPEVQFTSADGTATVDYEKLFLSDWDSPVLFSTIIACRVEETLGKQKLIIDYKLEGQDKKQSRKVSFKDFTRDGVNLLQVFEKYYSRHVTARNYQAQKASEEHHAQAAA